MSTQIDLLKKYKIPIRGQWGQNFLIDPNIQRKIVALLDLSSSDYVLEIGPGLGALTGEILKSGAKVWAVEKDKRFLPILSKELGEKFPDEIKIIHEDILKLDLKQLFSSTVFKNKKVKIISNLPYYITSKVLFHLIECRHFISQVVLTMQKEVAQRIMAVPCTKDYGRLTLGVRLFADVHHAFDIPAACFTPKPEVKSSTLILSFHPDSRLPSPQRQIFLIELFQAAFSQRRKTLLHLLIHDKRISGNRDELSNQFQQAGLSEKVRGEELTLYDYLKLAELIKG